MQGRMLAHELFHGIDSVEPPLPEVLVVPGILADGDGQANAVELNHLLGLGWREVALLVKDVVEGQEPLVLLEEQLALVEEHSGVEGRLTVFASGGQRNARQHCGGQLARCAGELVDCGTAAGEEAGFLKKVGGRITADGELGEDGEARALLRRSPADGNDSFEISREIPDRRIDLGQCDLHNYSLNG